MHTTHNESKGFTLIELLIVIAIVAILSVVVILTLNPAELLKQARDSNRISDLATIKSAIALYLADGQTWAASSTSCAMSVSPPQNQCGGFFSAQFSTSTGSTTNNRAVNGSGWINLNFSGISSGAPLGNLPVDPVNNSTYYYAYAASTTNSAFEIDAKMESSKFTVGGSSDVVTTDGGSSSTVYEVGTKLDM